MTIKLFTLHQQTKLAEKREQPYRIGLQVQKTSFIDILVHSLLPQRTGSKQSGQQGTRQPYQVQYRITWSEEGQRTRRNR